MPALGNRVVNLKRIRIGKIQLGSLRPGEYAALALAELAGGLIDFAAPEQFRD
jgi:16S rRNA U516 pseudouridylate synthase RsuA-like enzyme